jgi:hypothetical protein
MFSKLKKIFARKEPVYQEDADFGYIVFIDNVAKEHDPYWEMQGVIEFPEHKAKIQCVGIPGDVNGPYESSRSFLKSKFLLLPHIWKICHEELVKTIDIWYPEKIGQDPKKIFTLCAININDQEEWEVCFEADAPYKWVYLGLQFQGDECVSGTLDT